MDPWPADHHVYDMHLWVHANMEATPLPCMWEGKVAKKGSHIEDVDSEIFLVV